MKNIDAIYKEFHKDVKGSKSMNFNEEQQEIIKLVDSLLDNEHSGYGWGHFQGDVIPRILAYYVNMHLPNNRKIVGPNVYINDVPTQFDLMIVDSDSNPIPFTSAYLGEHIRCVIEVKRRGSFGNMDTFRKAVERIKTNFDKALFELRFDRDKPGFVKEGRANCKAAHIIISETVNPKREGSHKYGNITKELLAPYPVFILHDSRSKAIQYGEWQGFIEYITSDV